MRSCSVLSRDVCEVSQKTEGQFRMKEGVSEYTLCDPDWLLGQNITA